MGAGQGEKLCLEDMMTASAGQSECHVCRTRNSDARDKTKVYNV